MPTSDGWSKTWTFFDGDWHEGNVPIMGVRSHAAWLGSMVFDGARAFEGVAPDLDLHCARVNASARTFFLKPIVSVEHLARPRPRRDAPVRPRHGALHPADVLGRAGRAAADRAETGGDALVPHALRGADAQARRVLASRCRRSAGRRSNCMPVDAKAGCLYPNNARAHARGAARAASTTASCATCWAMSPSSPTPTSSWRRTASCSRRCRTAPSSTASRASG